MLKIDRASNGYVATLDLGDGEQEVHVFADNLEGTQELLHYVLENTKGHGSRYDSERLYIVNLPGDKYEGELTKEQRHVFEWLSSVVKRGVADE